MITYSRNLIYFFIICFVATIVSSCVAEGPGISSSLPTYMDIHAVASAGGLERYNLSSFSDINRNAPIVPSLAEKLELVNSGSIDDWDWSIYAAPKVICLVKLFNKEQVVSIGTGVQMHYIRIPSWRAAMMEWQHFYRAIMGSNLIALHAQIGIYPENVHVYTKRTLHSNNAIPIYFAFAIPENAAHDASAAYQWLQGVISIMAHEYWHAYNREKGNAYFINAMTDEITAYTLETCVDVALSNGQSTYYFNYNGHPIDVENLLDERKKIESNRQGVNISDQARSLSIYNIVWVLKTNVIKKHDIDLKEKLYGLCYAMVHSPEDLINGFYPRDKVIPMAFNG